MGVAGKTKYYKMPYGNLLLCMLIKNKIKYINSILKKMKKITFDIILLNLMGNKNYYICLIDK